MKIKIKTIGNAIGTLASLTFLYMTYTKLKDKSEVTNKILNQINKL